MFKKNNMVSRLPLIILLNIGAAVLFCSLVQGSWFQADKEIFFFFNHLLTESNFFLYLVGVTNFRAFDLVSFSIMALIFYSYYKKKDAEGRRRMFSMGLAMLFSVMVIKFIDNRILDFGRESASLYFYNQGFNVNFVSEILGWHVKDASGGSFPGDHSMMLLIFTVFMWRYCGKKSLALCLPVFIIFSMPRIMSGAHWFTDSAVGATSMVMLVLSWMLLTPFSDRLIDKISQRLPLKYFQSKHR